MKVLQKHKLIQVDPGYKMNQLDPLNMEKKTFREPFRNKTPDNAHLSTAVLFTIVS